MKEYIAATLTVLALATPAASQEFIFYEQETSSAIPIRKEQEPQRPSLIAINERRRINNLLRDDAKPLQTSGGEADPTKRRREEEEMQGLIDRVNAFDTVRPTYFKINYPRSI